MQRIFLDRNEHQYGPAPACSEVLQKIGLEQLSFYSRDYLKGKKSGLSERLAADFGIPEKRILLGYGSEDLLKQVVHCYLDAGDTILLPQHSWWYYQSVASEVFGQPVLYPLPEGEGSFEYDPEAVVELYDRHHPRVILIASPNNPTGNSITNTALRRIVTHCRQSVIVLDQAYYGFSRETADDIRDLVEAHPRIIVLRTFSKYFALAGLRIGYAAVGEGLDQLIAFSARYLGYNRISEMAALAALDNNQYYQSVALRMEEDKQRLTDQLSSSPGFTVFRSDANFILVRFPCDQKELMRSGLLESGIVVKFFEEAALADCMRITIGTRAQTRRLQRALGRILDGAEATPAAVRVPNA